MKNSQKVLNEYFFAKSNFYTKYDKVQRIKKSFIKEGLFVIKRNINNFHRMELLLHLSFIYHSS